MEAVGERKDRTSLEIRASGRFSGGKNPVLTGPIVGEIVAPGTAARSLKGGFVAPLQDSKF